VGNGVQRLHEGHLGEDEVALPGDSHSSCDVWNGWAMCSKTAWLNTSGKVAGGQSPGSTDTLPESTEIDTECADVGSVGTPMDTLPESEWASTA